MASAAPGALFVWILIPVLGIGVYGLRLSFIHFHGIVKGFPPRLENALVFIPAAILAALITPAIFPLDGSLADTLLNARVLAGSLALVTAWRTRSMIATIGVGMSILWIVKFLAG